jgi:hypothetical protein
MSSSQAATLGATASDLRAGTDADLSTSDPHRPIIKTKLSEAEILHATRNTLLEQFFSTLQITYLNALEAHDRVDDRPLVIASIERLFSTTPRTWQVAYCLELQLTQIMTPAQIDTEWIRRVGEAESLGLSHVANLTKKYSESDSIDVRRAVMQRLLNDLQWYYQQRIRRRDAAQILAERVSRIFWIAFLIFVLLLFFQFPLNEDFAPPASVGPTVQGVSP